MAVTFPDSKESICAGVNTKPVKFPSARAAMIAKG